MLASRLKLLVSHGLLDVSSVSSGASYHEYTLTDKGRALLPVLTGLAQWGNEFLFDDEEPRSLPLDSKSGRPLAPLQMRSQDGRDLDVLDVVVPRPEPF
jgi:DNA-binding PadR family transcriptional regulator